MKIPVIKKLVEEVDLSLLKQSEEAILEEQKPPVEIEGKDEGEQLTHVMAAIWIKEEMQKNKSEFQVALRAYTARVRKSIN
jgi:hypothetical protein